LHRYTAFGLEIQSDWPLPDLLTSSGTREPDVAIVRRPVELPAGLVVDDQQESGVYAVLSDESFYAYPHVARYRVVQGSRIEVDFEPDADEGLVRHVLLGPVLASLLWRRELLVLHAGVISMGDRTVAFMANSGEGKSTLSSALYRHGHRMLSDDVAVLPWRERPISVLPGYPRMKVYPEVLEQVGVDPESRPRIHSGIEKRAFMADGLPSTPQRLSALYVLARGDTERVRRLSPPEALLALMTQTYRPNLQVAHVGRQELMKRCARIVEEVPVFVLERPRELSRLDLLARFIEAHVAQLA